MESRGAAGLKQPRSNPCMRVPERALCSSGLYELHTK